MMTVQVHDPSAIRYTPSMDKKHLIVKEVVRPQSVILKTPGFFLFLCCYVYSNQTQNKTQQNIGIKKKIRSSIDVTHVLSAGDILFSINGRVLGI